MKLQALALLLTTLLVSIDLNSQALVISRRGEHVGISIGTGVSATAGHIDSINITPGFTFNINADMPIYITHYQGIWVQLSYNNLSANTDNNLINIQTMGVSLRYLWNPPDNSGFFITAGGTLYFPIDSYVENKKTHRIEPYLHLGERMFGLSTSAGINIIKTTYLSINTGISFDIIVPELPRPTIFTVNAFIGFTYRVGHRKNKTYYTKNRYGKNLKQNK